MVLSSYRLLLDITLHFVKLQIQQTNSSILLQEKEEPFICKMLEWTTDKREKKEKVFEYAETIYREKGWGTVKLVMRENPVDFGRETFSEPILLPRKLLVHSEFMHIFKIRRSYYSPFHLSLQFQHLHHTRRPCVPKI